MKKYRYTAANPTAFLIDGKEQVLHPGETYELPTDNGNVKTRVSMGHLQEVAPEPKPDTRKTGDKDVDK
jgi:hypothetical protein